MSVISRIQMSIHTIEGEVVTSTQLEFSGRKGEFMTAASIAFLNEIDVADVYGFANSNKLIMRERHGQQWIEMHDVMKLLRLTRTDKSDLLNTT